MSKRLPPQPNLRHLRNQAKQLLKAHQAADPEAASRIAAVLPRLRHASQDEIFRTVLSLQDAQFVVAREYGFESWPKLVSWIRMQDEIKAAVSAIPANNKEDGTEEEIDPKVRALLPPGLDLSGCRLTGVRLEAAKLEGLSLTKTNLTNADFRGADLTDANFNSADLSGSIFAGANLRGARITGASLKDTDFSGQDLGEISWTGVSLYMTNLRGAKLDHYTHLVGSDLSGASFADADLRGTRVTGAILVRANFEGANLRGVAITGSNLEEADFQGADLQGLTVVGVDLKRHEYDGDIRVLKPHE